MESPCRKHNIRHSIDVEKSGLTGEDAEQNVIMFLSESTWSCKLAAYKSNLLDAGLASGASGRDKISAKPVRICALLLSSVKFSKILI